MQSSKIEIEKKIATYTSKMLQRTRVLKIEVY